MRLSKQKRDRIILVCLLTVGICFGLWHGVMKSRMARIGAEQARLEAEQKRFEEARGWLERAQRVEADLESATAAVREFEDKMASEADTYAWSYVLLDRARQSYPVEIIDVSRPQLGAMRLLPQFPYRSATFTVTGRAYYHDFGQFLADFENNHPYFCVENVDLSRQSASATDTARAVGNSEILSFKIDIVALIRPTSR
jgi:hypothetical protein